MSTLFTCFGEHTSIYYNHSIYPFCYLQCVNNQSYLTSFTWIGEERGSGTIKVVTTENSMINQFIIITVFY